MAYSGNPRGRGRGGYNNNMDRDGEKRTSKKIYVGNLPETIRRVDLLSAFEKFGKVTECDIVRDYAFVHFDTTDEAEVAVAALDDSEFQGTTIKVELSHSRVRQKPGMGDTDACYRCGGTGHWSKNCPKVPSDRRYGPGTPVERRERGSYSMRKPYERDNFREAAYAYYRERFPAPMPPASYDRYRPYPDTYERRPMPPREPSYFRGSDPYTRPPPDYYSKRVPSYGLPPPMN